ncbi:MAG: MarC family protein [Desulfomonilia bacterium]
MHQRRTASVDFNFPESVLTAGTVAILFLFGGRELLRLLGITIAEFMVAAGLLILVIALSDVISSR